MKTLLAAADATDEFIKRFCKLFSFIALFLVAAISLQVFLRYALDKTSIKIEELQWHLYGALILIGFAYCQVKKTHVRVDVFKNFFSKRMRLIIDIFGTVFFAGPFFVIVFFHGVEYVQFSFMIGEASDAPSGLPLRWVIKGFIPFGFLLMFIGCLTALIRDLNQLFSRGNP